MKKQVSASFSRAASTYASHARVQRRAAQRLAACIPPGKYDTLLDIGCGEGQLARLLGKTLRWQQYLALDNAPGMLTAFDAGKQHAKQGQICKIAGDGEALPFVTGCADMLVSSSAMQWYADPWHCVPQAIRLLRPGGYFAVSVFVQGTLCELEHVSGLTGFGSVVPLLSATDYEQLFVRIPGITFSAARHTDVCLYPAVRDMLGSLQKTGVTGTPGKRAVSTKAYRAFCEQYARLYTCSTNAERNVRATYESVCLWGTVSDTAR